MFLPPQLFVEGGSRWFSIGEGRKACRGGRRAPKGILFPFTIFRKVGPTSGDPDVSPSRERSAWEVRTRSEWAVVTQQRARGGGYQPGVTSPKADSLVRSDWPPRRTASFRSPACTRGSHTARQRESGSAPSAPSKSRPSRIPSLLLTLLRVFPREADSPATFALDQRSPPQIVRFK